MSCNCLGIPVELADFLPTVSIEKCASPVWSFSKHESGYSLKIFWRTRNQECTPIKAHSGLTMRKLRSRQRMDKFIAKKIAESKENAGNPVSDAGNPVPVLRDVDGSATSYSDQSNVAVHGGSDNSSSVVTESVPTEDSAPSKLVSSSSVKEQSNGQMHDSETNSSRLDPNASRTRSKNRVQDTKVDAVHQLRVRLSDRVTKTGGVTKVYEDFVKCDDARVSDTVRDEMKKQWSSSIYPGLKVMVKECNETVSANILECNYTSKLSFDCLYYYATAKASVKILDSNSTKEVQFRDLILLTNY